MMRMRFSGVVVMALMVAGGGMPSRAAGSCDTTQSERWTLIGTDTFQNVAVAPRSQGVVRVPTVLGTPGWVFSGLNGLMEKTDDAYHTLVLRPMPAAAIEPSVNADGTNHVTGTHIGDIDYYDGKIYASIEDGNESEGPVSINNPEYQHPYIAVFDAQTLLFEGKHALPVDHQIAGVPWVAANGAAGELYTSEWNQDHNRINVYDMKTFALTRTIPLVYPPELGTGFKLDRIQGMKLLNGALYGTRDDAAKTIYKVDLSSGVVSKMFSLDPPAGVPAEVEGLAVHYADDGTAILDVMLILDNSFDASLDFANIRTELRHYALSCA